MEDQAITHPFGVTVFGSAIARVEPDIASLQFSVSRLEQQPKDAFQAARDAAQQVQAYLNSAGVTDAQSSQVSLEAEFQHTNQGQKFMGYRARIDFHVLLHEIARMEEVLTGVIDAGVNHLRTAEFQVGRLKELRADARTRAVQDARKKAELYCKAAGVALGAVVHIEDANPDRFRRYPGSHGMHEAPIQIEDEETPSRAMNPGSIVVGAAVRVAFSFAHA